MKLCILGGGGFRTPYIYQALLHDAGDPRVDEVTLYDVDEARLGTMTQILSEFAEGVADAPTVTATTDLRAAVAGSDFIFAAIRVGGLEGRRCDEHVALDRGVLGQETTGPGGLAYALRTLPVMLEVARVVKELAPNAFVLNFTNPAGIITEAMQAELGDRVLGICDTPSGLGRRAASLLGLDHTRVQLDYVGLNHLGWLRGLHYDGTDRLPELLGDSALLAGLEEGQVFGTEWIRALGVIPNEYLYYYYFTRDAVNAIQASGKTRGDFLAVSQAEFYEKAKGLDSGRAELWRATVDRRSASYMAEATGGTQDAPITEKQHEPDPSHQGYAGVALGVMNAIARNERQTMILNVRNGGAIPGLPVDAVVELPTMVDANGVHPIVASPPTLHQIGLMSQIKQVERGIIAAASSGSREEAVTAFALHPLVDSVTVARQLVDGYIAGIPEVAAVLHR
ncbi:6-phospho-beta-glucosidase [Leifsonia sp. NPDC102414]|uniref:6-phospho-beta-glucosidase n=1 Tax=Leifsonia sp. NPDC102414 TaxID=3364124 RepID=UPI00380087C9